MNQEHALAVLYDLTLAVGSEIRLELLLKKVLQRFLFHTSFPVGLVVIEPRAQEGGQMEGLLALAIGDQVLRARTGQPIRLPTHLLSGPPSVLTNGLDGVGGGDPYTFALRLPVESVATILLLSRAPMESELPLEQIFVPVLRNLARSITLCAGNDRLTLALEADLRHSERRYRAAFETSIDAISISRRRDGVYTHVNQAFLDILGYSREEIEGHTAVERGIWVDLDLRDRVSRSLVEGSVARDIEAQFRRKDGRLVWGMLSSTLLELEAEPCVLSVARDITAMKAAQAELVAHRAHLEDLVRTRTADLELAHARLRETEFAMDRVGIGIQWVALDTGRFLYANAATAAALGYRVDEMLELHIRDVYPGFSDEGYEAFVARARASGSVRLEAQTRTRAGLEVPVEVSAHVLAAREGAPERVVAFVTDISQRKADELALRRAKEAAEAASVAKTAFLANMSHEIRTPLNAITGMAHLIRRGGLSREQSERLDKLEGAGHHLLEIVNAVLDISKIEAGKFVLEQAEVDVEAITRNVVSMVAARAEAKGLVLEVDTATARWPLLGDPTRLQQALLNYVANAVKFTESGRIHVRTSVQSEAPTSVLLRFEVRDTGVGVPDGAIDRLFSAFEQADNTTTRRYGGTGLGLAITRRLAELMGGEAGANSTFGVGSTFWFTARLDRAPMEAKHTVVQVRTLRRQRRTILLVEDEPVNREIGVALLEEEGHRVDVAPDGIVAVELAAREAYDLILMDMQMPRMDGLDATRAIRELGVKVPIVAMTAAAFAEDRARCLAAGMDDFLSKPVRPRELSAMLGKWLADSAHPEDV